MRNRRELCDPDEAARIHGDLEDNRGATVDRTDQNAIAVGRQQDRAAIKCLEAGIDVRNRCAGGVRDRKRILGDFVGAILAREERTRSCDASRRTGVTDGRAGDRDRRCDELRIDIIGRVRISSRVDARALIVADLEGFERVDDRDDVGFKAIDLERVAGADRLRSAVVRGEREAVVVADLHGVENDARVARDLEIGVIGNVLEHEADQRRAIEHVMNSNVRCCRRAAIDGDHIVRRRNDVTVVKHGDEHDGVVVLL